MKLEPKQPPSTDCLTGKFVRLESVAPADHAAGFDKHLCGPTNEALWKYIPFGAPGDSEALFATLAHMEKHLGWRSFAMRDLASAEVTGTISLMRIRPEHGSAEVGCVVFGKALQRTRAATEAIHLLATYLIEELGYRRFEWKCDNENQASRRAAGRFGFSFEGVFRNDMIVNGRNRDTAWYAITDADWRRLKSKYQVWLSADNFDEKGVQRFSLKDLVNSD